MPGSRGKIGECAFLLFLTFAQFILGVTPTIFFAFRPGKSPLSYWSLKGISEEKHNSKSDGDS